MRKLFSILVLSVSLALAAPSSVVVQSGDTLGSIAARNGVSVQALLKANNLNASSTLKIGQVLKIPGSSSQKTGSITVQSGDTLGSIAKRYGISVNTLKAINGLSSDSVSVGQVLRLSGSSAKQKPSASNSQSSLKSGTVIVQSGDTLGKIALQNNTTVAALKALNGLSSNDLKLGQVLKISGSSSTTAKNSSEKTTKSSTGTVTVKAGDTLGEIAQANNTSVAKLKALNGLSSNDLKLGQVLKVTGSIKNTVNSSDKTSPSTSKTSESTVTVKAGDSLSKIAQDNDTSIAALRSANNLSSDNLKLGQVLKLGKNAPQVSTSSNKTTTAKTPSLPASIKVQKGDNLSKIAKQYGLSIESIRKLNNLKSDDLALGQSLKLKATVVAKTNKPLKPTSSSTAKSKPAKTGNTTSKTNSNKPKTATKPNANTSKENPSSTALTKPSTSIGKTTANATNKPSSSASKPAATNKKPEVAKTNALKPETKPNTTKPSISPTKPTTTVQEIPKPAPVASKPTPVKPTTIAKPAPQPTKPVAAQPSAKPAVNPKPTQPSVETQPTKPVMNEAVVSDNGTQNNKDANSSEPATITSDASNPSSVPATTEISSNSIPGNSADISTVPQPETDQSQSGVGSDADYIIIEPQNSLEVVGQRTGSVASTTPAKPPTNTTPQQIAKYNRERLLWPLQGVLTSYYGYRSLRIGRSHFHTGLDIAAPRGTPVYAALSGRVEQAGWSRVGYGNLVIIRGWDGRRYYYGHNSRLLVKAGQWVNQGTMISRVGSTGYATGPHLHFEVRVGGHTRNPIAYLPRSQVQFARYAPKR
jgi:LysM repeat protein